MQNVLTSLADTQSDPPKDPPTTTASSNVEAILHVARYLLTYGRHLIDTIRQRSAAPRFEAIAACFGTSNLTTIIAHLNRGILRCMALERILLARQAAGKDIAFSERPIYDLHEMFAQEAAAEAAPQPEPPSAAEPAALPTPRRRGIPRASRPAGWDDPELFMPTVEDLERQMRRHPIGRIILAIMLDLGVVPAFCHPTFFNSLFDIMNWFGGGTAIPQLVQEKTRRREAFAKEQDRVRGANWDWLAMSREALRQVLGFFIGEPPVNPLDPAPATGPP